MGPAPDPDAGIGQAPDQAEGNVKAAFGFGCAPVVASFLAGLAYAIGIAVTSRTMADFVGAFTFVFGFGLLFAYAAVFILGAPVYLLLCWKRIASLWVYGTLPLPFGFLIAFLLRDKILGFNSESFLMAVQIGVLGSVAAIVFWYIARPDKYVRPHHKIRTRKICPNTRSR